MATQISKDRQLFFEEELCRGTGVSESILKKVGQVTNFINLCQLIRDDFKANGIYSLGAGTTGLDGILIFPTNVEIVFIGASSQRPGQTGVTEFDIHWLSDSCVDEGSIFSTTPTFDSTSCENAYTLTNVLDEIDIVTTTGATNPRVTKTKFLQGEAIRCDLVTGMNCGQDAQVNVFYRPVN